MEACRVGDGSVRAWGSGCLKIGWVGRPRLWTEATLGPHLGFWNDLPWGRCIPEPWPQSATLRSGLDHLLCQAVLVVSGIRGVQVRAGLWSCAVWTLPESKLPAVCKGRDDGSSVLPRLLFGPAHTEARIPLCGRPPD